MRICSAIRSVRSPTAIEPGGRATWWGRRTSGSEAPVTGSAVDELDRVIDADARRRRRRAPRTILHVPGHSPGHLAVWLPAERAAIVGDAAMGRGIPYLDGSLMYAPQYHDPERYLATLGRLARLDPDVLLGAHFAASRQRRRGVPRGQRGGRAPDRSGRPGGASCGRLTTLANLCVEVHRRYGDLPVGTEHELATTIAGTLAAMVARGEAVLVSAGPPRCWRAAPEQRT